MTNQTLHTSYKEGARNRALSLLVLLLFYSSVAVYADSDPPNELERKAFIEQISRIAIAEQEISGIPASITAAQAIFESSWGQSPLATVVKITSVSSVSLGGKVIPYFIRMMTMMTRGS